MNEMATHRCSRKLLSTQQVQQFVRDGFLVLPAFLDPQLCGRARDEMWRVLNAHVPRLVRGDSNTWGPFVGDELGPKRKASTDSHVGGDPLFDNPSGHRFYIRNGTSELMLDLCPRALFPVAEQLLGVGTVVYPEGLDENGMAMGPAFSDLSLQSAKTTHMDQPDDAEPSFRTEPFSISATGPGWINGQGTRGLYCTMPNSPDARMGAGKGNPPFAGCHSDGSGDGRVRLRVAAFIDECPAGCGGFTIWRGSHVPIWASHWTAQNVSSRRREELQRKDPGLTTRELYKAAQAEDSYSDEVFDRVKQAEPVEVHGPAGTVVLWHGVLAHIVGTNSRSDVIRQATIYDFHKTQASLPDEELLRRLDYRHAPPGLWDDWSTEVQRVAATTPLSKL